MADKFYNEDTSGIVNNIDVILGTDADYVLPMTIKTFGNISSFIETPIGVVLAGSVERMCKNINDLPVKINSSAFQLCCSPETVTESDRAGLPPLLPCVAVSPLSSTPSPLPSSLVGREPVADSLSNGEVWHSVAGVEDVSVIDDSFIGDKDLDRILNETLNLAALSN